MFKVGDRVYDILNKKVGTVEKRGYDNKVNVRFDDLEQISYCYNHDGSWYDGEVPRLIFLHQVKDVVIPKPERPFDLKEFLASVPRVEFKPWISNTVAWINEERKFSNLDRSYKTIEPFFTKENAKKIAETLNKYDVTFDEYKKAVGELIAEGVF